jgi:hypothetical protein
MAGRSGEGFQASHWPNLLTDLQQHILMLRQQPKRLGSSDCAPRLQGSLNPLPALLSHAQAFPCMSLSAPPNAYVGAMSIHFLDREAQLIATVTCDFAEVAATVLVAGMLTDS